jgi:tetratricopeptide (TPR) repeat protein
MLLFNKRQRPILRPSRYFRFLRFMSIVQCALNWLKRAVVAAVVLLLFLYVYPEVMRPALVIDPFSVPKGFEESGLTPEVVSNRIGDELRRIETEANTRLEKDKLTSLEDEGGATPDIEIPGTKMGLKVLVDATRAVFQKYPRHVSGDIVTLKNQQLKITIYTTKGRDRGHATSLLVNSNNVDEAARRTAETVLEQVNPYILALYLNDHHGEFDRMIMLVSRAAQDEGRIRKYRAAAFSLWGRVLSDHRKYDEAIEKYKQGIAVDCKYSAPYIDWGNTLSNQGNYDDAINKYKQAVAIEANYAVSYNNWGNALSAQGNYDDAIDKYKQAIALNHEYIVAYNDWAGMLLKQGKYDEAIDKYKQAIALGPDVATYNNWGKVLRYQRKYDEAIKKYKQAIAGDPEDPTAYNNWGYALSAQGKYDEGIEKYKQTIALDPEYAVAYVNWGEALSGKKKYDEAIEKYKQAIALDPKNAYAYNRWGNALREQKNMMRR